MEIRPILASLRKHRIPAILIVLEIALACAVLCNAVFMISQRVVDIHRPMPSTNKASVVITLRGTTEEASSDIPRNLARVARHRRRAGGGGHQHGAAEHQQLGLGVRYHAGYHIPMNTNVSLYFLGEGRRQGAWPAIAAGAFLQR
jgi:putative ABC transport system permease protein